jgi:hypothetical protein
VTDQETERALRERAIALRDELRGLLAQAASLFRTSGWVRVENELPPIELQVLGSRNGMVGWYTRLDHGKWMHDYMNGHLTEEPWGPEFWMVLPEVPE